MHTTTSQQRAAHLRTEAAEWVRYAERASDPDTRRQILEISEDCERLAVSVEESFSERSALMLDVPSKALQGKAKSLVIMTMVYNEGVNLPIWVQHYRKVAPTAVLFVIDHSSNDGSIEHLPGVFRIPIPRDSMDEHDRSFMVNSLQHGFLRYYETVIYTDCDELIVPDPRRAATLEEYLSTKDYSYSSPIGINVTHIVDVEGPLDFSKPVLPQRRYGQFRSVMCKPLVTRVELNWHVGFHSCDRPLNIDRDLYLLHIKTIDKNNSVRRQRILRQIEWSVSGIEAGHGAHHRYEDARFLREYFLDPANVLRHQPGPGEFVFDDEINRVYSEVCLTDEGYYIPDFAGPIVEIPEAFRTSV